MDLFTLLDTDQSGDIDFREFLLAQSAMSLVMSSDQTLKVAFDVFDDNSIDQHNVVVSYLQGMGECLCVNLTAPSDPIRHRSPKRRSQLGLRQLMLTIMERSTFVRLIRCLRAQ